MRVRSPLPAPAFRPHYNLIQSRRGTTNSRDNSPLEASSQRRPTRRCPTRKLPMPKISHTLLAAGLLSLSAGAMAQPAPPPGAPENGPRMRAPETRAELKTQLEARFDRMDANHDGKIDEKD